METNNEPTFSDDVHKRWYDQDTVEINQPMRELLEKYSNVPTEQVVPHVNKIRQRAFAIKPYPCIGQYRFLNLTLLTHPMYDAILSRLREDASTRYVDLACCVGQDLRQLAADGITHEQLIGVDIQAPFINLGYDLFQDHSTFKGRFLIADIFKGSEQGQVWMTLEEAKPDIVHCSAFLHMFSLFDQKRAARNIAKLVRPNGMIVGRQVGSIKPGEFSSNGSGDSQYMHNIITFRQLWNEVGRDTGTKWQVDGSMDMIGIHGNSENGDTDHRRLLFTIIRLA